MGAVVGLGAVVQGYSGVYMPVLLIACKEQSRNCRVFWRMDSYSLESVQ